MHISRTLCRLAGLVAVAALPAVVAADAGNPNFSPQTNKLTIPVLNINGEVGFVNIELRMDFDEQTFEILNLENVPRSPIPLREIDEHTSDFPAKAGQTYVVELWDVARSFESMGGGNCDGSFEYGIGLAVTDPDGNEIARQCDPNGWGEVYTYVQFEAGRDGRFRIDVVPNEAGAKGGFRLRVQPFHDDPGARWNQRTEEPNNHAVNAFGLGLGATQALASEIEERNSSFAAVRADLDWFRFDAVAGQTYAIELFNVSRGLGETGGGQCDGSFNDGVGLLLADPTLTLVASKCDPFGTGNVYNLLTFKTGLGGPHYIGVVPNGEVTGRYEIRVLPQHDDPAATWDPKSFEPNNRAAVAYPIEVDETLASKIEERNISFATNRADVDWYRFEARSGQSYEARLLDVDTRLAEDGGGRCDGRFEDGVGLVVADPDRTAITSQCEPQVSGDTHNVLSFKAGRRGTHYIGVVPNGDDGFGRYRLRLIEK